MVNEGIEEIDLLVKETFEFLFHQRNVANSIEASCYYSCLARSCAPVTLASITKKSKIELYTKLPPTCTRNARDSLFDNGYLSKVLLEKEFGTEAYIPANPRVLWNFEEENLREWFRSDYENRKELAEKELFSVFDRRYGEYGVRAPVIGNEKLTMTYRLNWFLSFLLQFENKEIKMCISGMRLFDKPLSDYFKKMLDRGCSIKAIVDRRED